MPCATIAYSLKARGVFGSCGQSDQVADARSISTGDAVEVVTRSFDERARIGSELADIIPGVVERARVQFHEILRIALRQPTQLDPKNGQ